MRLSKLKSASDFGTIGVYVFVVDEVNIQTYFPIVEELIVFSPSTPLISGVITNSVHFALWKKATTECKSIIWPEGTDFNSIFVIKNRAHFISHQTFAISEGW
jgi:hypothetical protein